MADFGLSESMDVSKDYFRQDQKDVIKLPIKWLAPESISDAVFSVKSDVVSRVYLRKGGVHLSPPPRVSKLGDNYYRPIVFVPLKFWTIGICSTYT